MTNVPDAALPLGGAAPSLGPARRRAFYIVLAAALLLIVAPMVPFLVIPIAWPFMAEELGVHQFHDVGVATMLWFMVAGLLAQFRRAERQVAAMQQVLLVILTMIVLTAVSRPETLGRPDPLLLFFVLAFAVAALHPARAAVARPKLRADPILAGLVLLAAGPALVYAHGQLRLDHSALPLAAHGGHWTAVAILTVAMVLLALLGATRPIGWRVPVWSVGGAALLFGVSSAALPHVPSSIGPVSGGVAAVWGVAFVFAAEVRDRGELTGELAERKAIRE